ncbi:GRPE, molecular chaperone GrpE [Nostoc flagelliforme CCNUN1]|uniref:GRPE, molecular chaperone GrpE n=1 Tax=Nostoc flagelliforme CCNUN1 TaxID=2038116 RepID=A0A2K8T1I6_9NOSO|nr:nucleotide exchange factor GrpE [Nostoc flagelliforme]AUB41541.1 GRPE, molecular chaperone GrpE [Nostoc flagelliforme CCNUN1]
MAFSSNSITREIFIKAQVQKVREFLTFCIFLSHDPNPSPEFIQLLPKPVGAVNRKFLGVLGKRQVLPIQIELQSTQPDFNLCRVVEREVRKNVADQTITKIVRRGFSLREKTLRPTEVITSKTSVGEL